MIFCLQTYYKSEAEQQKLFYWLALLCYVALWYDLLRVFPKDIFIFHIFPEFLVEGTQFAHYSTKPSNVSLSPSYLYLSPTFCCSLFIRVVGGKGGRRSPHPLPPRFPSLFKKDKLIPSRYFLFASNEFPCSTT